MKVIPHPGYWDDGYVPQEYLESLPNNTPVKIEVGAIGGDFEIDSGELQGRAGRPLDDDNATFTEEGEFCVNEVDPGCENIERPTILQ